MCRRSHFAKWGASTRTSFCSEWGLSANHTLSVSEVSQPPSTVTSRPTSASSDTRNSASVIGWKSSANPATDYPSVCCPHHTLVHSCPSLLQRQPARTEQRLLHRQVML